jgi:hypothetical protein
MASTTQQKAATNNMNQQHATIKEQSILLSQQEKLIHALATLIESNGLGHLLDGGKGADASGNNSPDKPPGTKDEKEDVHKNCGPLSYGPGSPPVNWTGDASDIALISIHGKEYKGFIFDDEMVGYWNRLLDLRRKLPRYKQDYEEEYDLEYDCHQMLQRCTDLEAAGLPQEVTAAERIKLAIAEAAAEKRSTLLDNQLKPWTYTKRILNTKIARFVRGVLIRSDLRAAEGTGWIEDLRASKMAKFKDGAAFDDRFHDEELNEVARSEPLEMPSPPGSEDGDSHDSNNDSQQSAT